MQRWEQNEGHLDVLNYSLKFAFFWCFLVPLPPPPTSLPIKIKIQEAGNFIWRMGDSAEPSAESFAGCPSLASGLWVFP